MSGARTVVITGGSRGLGAGLVRSFLESGDRVATCSRSVTPEIERWANDADLAGRFLHSVVDLQEPAAIERFVGEVSDAFEQVDVLVNNAGIAREGVLGLVSREDLDAVIDLNVKGTIWMTRAVVRRMLPRHKGRVINVSSIVGLSGYRGLPVYSASKAALDGFTRALARELGSHGITVNSVAPGYLRTEMSHGLDDRQLAQISRRTPAGRLGEPEDVASAVQFLASEGAAFVSGHVLVVDGGLIA